MITIVIAGKNMDGYWDGDKMTFQVAEILVAASMRYPDHEMWFLFDWSSCHDKMPPSIANASKFLLDEGFQYTKAGEKKPFLVGDMQFECEYPNKSAGIVFHGAGFGVQRVKYEAGEKPFFKPDAAKEYAGLPKGVRQLVWERGLYTEGMTRDGGKDKTEALSMVYAIMLQPDVKHQKSLLQLSDRGEGPRLRHVAQVPLRDQRHRARVGACEVVHTEIR